MRLNIYSKKNLKLGLLLALSRSMLEKNSIISLNAFFFLFDTFTRQESLKNNKKIRKINILTKKRYFFIKYIFI